MSRTEHVVTAAELKDELTASRPPALLDARWRLGEAPDAGRQGYAVGHVPGARFLDLEAVLTTHTDDPRDGRHPLPDLSTLERGLGELGVGVDDEVVVYDDPGSYAAPRAWWVLRWAGIHTRVLDGGLPAWVAAGGDLDQGDDATWERTAPRLTTGQLPILTADEAAEHPSHGVLMDARAAERYRGEVEPLDSRAGHIPGAVNLFAATLFTDDGTLPPDAELQAAVGDLTRDGDIAAYCGSGVSAAQNVLALAVIDVPAALFPGSWSAWSSDPERPVATGPEPG